MDAVDAVDDVDDVDDVEGEPRRMQRVIELSLAGASAFTRSLFEAEHWSAEPVIEFINATRNLTVASVSPSGVPHAAVVITACHEDQIHFTVMPGSTLARNVSHRPAIGFSVSDRSHAVMGQGQARRVGTAGECGELIAALAAASASGSFTPDGWNGDLYRIEVGRIFAS